MTRIVRQYTKEFKTEVVNLALKSPSVGHTAKELGISSATLDRWIHNLKKSGNLGLGDSHSAKDMAALIERQSSFTKRA